MLELGTATDVGKVREHNEDAFAVVQAEEGEALIVCDGMGGHAAGDVASNAARAAFASSVLERGDEDPRERIYHSMEAAHEHVLELAHAGPDRAGMGTTCVVAFVSKTGDAYIGNVGDSRAYLIRDGTVQRLSLDHTRVQKMVDGGILNEQEAAAHPDAGVLTQALGQKRGVEPFVREDAVDLRAGDALVLCSDGVYDCMSDSDLVTYATNGTAQQAANTLVRVATERDGNDNATVIVARMPAAAAPVAKTVVSPARLPVPVPTPPPQRGVPKTAIGAAAIGVVFFILGAATGLHFSGDDGAGAEAQSTARADEAAKPAAVAQAKAAEKAAEGLRAKAKRSQKEALDAQQRADDARNKAKEADKDAKAAKKEAHRTRKTADKKKAKEARATADAKKEASDDAQAEATKAQKKADDAQADATKAQKKADDAKKAAGQTLGSARVPASAARAIAPADETATDKKPADEKAAKARRNGAQR